MSTRQSSLSDAIYHICCRHIARRRPFGRVQRLAQKVLGRPGSSLQRLFHHIGHKEISDIRSYQQELLANDTLKERYDYYVRKGYISQKYDSWEARFGNLNQVPGATLAWFYALIRELKPDRIIETGTAAGSSTSIMLAALHANNCGELVSIDLPAEKGKRGMGWSLPEGEQAGFLIPDEYRRRWNLRVGDAKDLLVPAFREKRCDIFIHDSLHEYGHMMWEYVSALLNMETGGIIISDDIVENRGVWWKFISVFRLPCFIDLANPNVGVTAIKLIES